MGRRRFTREFKLEAVKLVGERNMAAGQAATDLRLHVKVPRIFVKNLTLNAAQAFPGRVKQRVDDAEVARLRRELAKSPTRAPR